MKTRGWLAGFSVFLASLLCSGVSFAEEPVYSVVIKDHQFVPRVLKIPQGKKVKIVIENQDATPEEFESYELNREKMVTGNGKITVFLGPLKRGTYKYFGEFHKDTAQGEILAE